MSAGALATWLVRYAHVAAATLWVGGYALLVFIVLPRVARDPGGELARLAMASVRWLTYAGTATLFFGILLIRETRGFDHLTRGPWGAHVLASAAIAVAVLGLGDGAVRPALRRAPAGAAKARRWGMMAFVLLLAAVGLMTRALYAASGGLP